MGSQAILGAYHETQLPGQAISSIEADIVVLDDPTGSGGMAVDAAIGMMSLFHTANGYYADGVEMSDLVLPVGWEGRRLHLVTEDAAGGSLDVYFVGVADLLAGKLGAGRPQDRRFAQAVARHLADGAPLVDLEEVRRLAATLDDGIGARTRAMALVGVLLAGGIIDWPNPPTFPGPPPPDPRHRQLTPDVPYGSSLDTPG
ncbi:MAG: hypothetical protein WEB03_15910 [Nitriliruptor sp.]|uniref:hypothetical protein n=1 Tax=Nitriliruptor sp. TaxID=2448056 RepID=UPI0034A02B94